MDLIKLVDYPSSDSENEAKEPENTPTPITFRGKRIFRRIIQSGEPSITRPKRKEHHIKRELAKQETPVKKYWTREESSRLKLNFDAITPKTPTPIKRKNNRKSPKTNLVYSPASEGTSSAKKGTPTSCGSKTPASCGQKTPAKKRWGKEESNRLKLALKAAINPTTQEHWELICRSLGGNHTIEECKEHAVKLDWKPPRSSAEEDKTKDEARQDNISQVLQKSPWRMAVDKRKSRRSVECSNKFFSTNVTDLTLTDLNLDDSMFSAAFSTPPEQAKCARRPFLIRVVAEGNDESTTDDE